MMDNLNLDNNYYLEILNNDINTDVEDIRRLNIKRIKNNRMLLFKINFDFLKKNEYKKILRKILKIKKSIIIWNSKNNKKKIKIGIKNENKNLLGYVINYDKENKDQKDFISAINAIFYNSKKEMYNYIYDTVCDYLDGFFYSKNLCDFKNNKCGEKRNTSSNIGCCRHYKNKLLGPLIKNNFIPCEYLKEDYTCGAKCLGCKLFTCDYLRKKGVVFRIKDILLLDVFFDLLQKYYIKTKVFTPKEKIIKMLMIL